MTPFWCRVTSLCFADKRKIKNYFFLLLFNVLKYARHWPLAKNVDVPLLEHVAHGREEKTTF